MSGQGRDHCRPYRSQAVLGLLALATMSVIWDNSGNIYSVRILLPVTHSGLFPSSIVAGCAAASITGECVQGGALRRATVRCQSVAAAGTGWALGGCARRVRIWAEIASGRLSGMSVANLLTMPLARGLFRRAIVQSGNTPNASDRGAHWHGGSPSFWTSMPPGRRLPQPRPSGGAPGSGAIAQ